MRHGALMLAVLAATTMGVVITPGVAGATEAPAPPNATCSQQTVAVAISPTDPTPYNLSGQLCLKDDNLRGSRAVMVMVSGVTYDRSYFNSSYQPYTYSWVYTATIHGYSTFNIDRLGVGQSSRPAAELLTVQNHAYTVEQVVRKLRVGKIGGRSFSTVIGIGHSLGAGVLQYLSGTVTDPAGVPDFLVFSGWLHQGNPAALASLGAALYPASSDPGLVSSGYPTGYLTTQPNSRGSNFYHTPGADPAMIALDEATKQTGTLEERQTLAAVRASTVTSTITVPVLLSVGHYDTLQCNEAIGLTCATGPAVRTREASYYGPRACLAAFVVPDTGHSVNLHYKGQDTYNYVNNWLDDYTINRPGSRDANGCLL